jgi:hypothetical protein
MRIALNLPSISMAAEQSNATLPTASRLLRQSSCLDFQLDSAHNFIMQLSLDIDKNVHRFNLSPSRVRHFELATQALK